MRNALALIFFRWPRRPETSVAGQGIVEYAIIVMVITLKVIGMLGILGSEVNDSYSTILANWPSQPKT